MPIELEKESKNLNKYIEYVGNYSAPPQHKIVNGTR